MMTDSPRPSWRRLPIEATCSRITSGGTPLRSNHRFYDGGSIRWVKTGELKDWYIEDTAEKITEEAIQESSAKLLPKDTVLIAMYGDGRTITSLGILRHQSACNQASCAMIANPAVCSPLFLFYSLKAHRRALLKLAYGGAQRNLNAKTIREFEIAVPPIPNQYRIASILSAYDDLIENNTRRIKVLEKTAQLFYREWFVNFNFPGHQKVKMVESELGPIPEEWEVKRLKDVAGVNELSIKTSSPPDRIYYIDIASVSTARIEKQESIRFSDAPGRARRIVRHGDTIWSTVRPNRRSYALILNPERNLIVSTGFAVLTAATVPYSYLYFAATTDEFADYLTNHTSGSAYPAVNAKDFENATLVVPKDSVANRFHEVTAPMLDLAWCLHQRNANLRTTRDFLLPKLISGEIPVEAAAEAMEQTA